MVFAREKRVFMPCFSWSCLLNANLSTSHGAGFMTLISKLQNPSAVEAICQPKAPRLAPHAPGTRKAPPPHHKKKRLGSSLSTGDQLDSPMFVIDWDGTRTRSSAAAVGVPHLAIDFFQSVQKAARTYEDMGCGVFLWGVL